MPNHKPLLINVAVLKYIASLRLNFGNTLQIMV